MNVKHFWSSALVLAAGIASQACAQTDASKIKLESFSGFNTPSVQELVVKHATPAFSQHLAGSKYALWVLVDRISTGGGSNYCIAFVGLTHAVANDMNPRIPGKKYITTQQQEKTGPLSEEEWNECKTDVLIDAIAAFSKRNDWNALAREADALTAERGGIRKREPADLERYQMFYSGNSSYKVDPGATFVHAFDYRQLQSVILSNSAVLGNTLVCYAKAGVAVRAPANRNPRFPGRTVSNVMVMDLKGDPAGVTDEQRRTCENEVAKDAIQNMLDQSWDQNGLLKNLAATREEGVALVTGPKQVPAAAPARKVNTTSVQRNTVTCHNECVNGSCLRTFSDGRKERWQAPRVFNPLTSNWEWQVNSCGN